MVSALSLETSDGFTIFVENRRLSISLYTFLELETWFEPEAEFVRLFLKSGMRVVDIGANCGFYTLLAAHRVGIDGKVWAFEPGQAASRLLAESISANHFGQASLRKAAIGRERGEVWFTDAADNELSKVTAQGSAGGRSVPMESLDALYADGELRNVDFIKIDAEEHEGEIIAGGGIFFEREDPVVMIEVSESHGPSQMLEAMGYQRFRFCAGTGCLLPYEGERAGEKNFNLFLCKPGRAGQLRETGLLVTMVDMDQSLPDASPSLFLDAYQSIAVVRSSPELQSLAGVAGSPSTISYYTVMAELLMSEQLERPSSERSIRLARAERYADQTFSDRTTLPELLGYCRIWRNTGRTLMAATALKVVIENSAHPQFSTLGLPFLPVLPHWEQKPTGASGLPSWLQAMTAASLETVHAFSSAFDGNATIQLYSVVRTAGYLDPWLERRAVLKAMLVGADPVPSPLFIGGDMRYNQAIWHGLAAHAKAGGNMFPDLPQAIELA